MRLRDFTFWYHLTLTANLFVSRSQSELSSRCKYSAKVLMRTEYSSQNPIIQISFDLVQFYTLILWTV